MSTPEVTLIVARARNGVIGMDNEMPWHLPEELGHFKRSTMGHALIVGRKTFESIGRPLPGRQMIVVTRNDAWHHDGCTRAASLEQAIGLVEPDRQCFIGGGAQLYKLALPIATRLLITEIDLDPPGDVFFPDPDPARWQLTKSEAMQSRTGTAFSINEWLKTDRS